MSDSNSNNLYSKLNLVPIAETRNELAVIPEESNATKIVNKDFDVARDNLHKIIAKGQDALNEIADIASQSQDAEAYTGLSSLINSLIAANRELLALSKKKQEFERGAAVSNPDAGKAGVGDTGGTTNIIFAGSTADILAAIKDAQDEENNKGKIIEHE